MDKVNNWLEEARGEWEEIKEDLTSAFHLKLPGRDPEKELIKWFGQDRPDRDRPLNRSLGRTE